MARWWGEAEVDPRPGGDLVVRMQEGPRPVMRGQFVELKPYERMSFTFGWEDTPGAPAIPPGASWVEITLTPESGGVTLTLRHSGLPFTLKGRPAKGGNTRSATSRRRRRPRRPRDTCRPCSSTLTKIPAWGSPRRLAHGPSGLRARLADLPAHSPDLFSDAMAATGSVIQARSKLTGEQYQCSARRRRRRAGKARRTRPAPRAEAPGGRSGRWGRMAR
ncbi:SRPBCC family protein [Micromonospora sp. CPCC 205546]|uniref:SRPBCC family protein n=1 Tax=Micromonospora sp. CPCC 205546 TaxID=3122397 RepID=UPI003FA5E1A4